MLSPPPLFPADTTKFFGCELGAQTKHDAASGMSIVNGAHETAKLQQLLEGFIKTFVQCYACHNPETVMAIDKAECITMRCKACGHLSKVDMRHKLTTFILKNPPENKESKAEKAARPAFKQYRERDGKFYFKLVDVRGRLLLQSSGFESPKEAAQTMALLTAGGEAALADHAACLTTPADVSAADVVQALQALASPTL